MKLITLKEPELQFCGGTHVDIRAGLSLHGAFDKKARHLPRPIRVGIIGTSSTTDGLRDWMERCRDGVSSSSDNRELRPDFPGVTDHVFGTKFEANDSTTRTVSRHELGRATSSPNPISAVTELFAAHARDLSNKQLNVLVVAPPQDVFDLGVKAFGSPEDQGLDESQDVNSGRPHGDNFHDHFKARVLDLAVPTQLIRPDTYGLQTSTSTSARRRNKRKRSVRRALQDEATRAWNFHTALYYKSGAIPWRLRRISTELATCFVGASFYKNLPGDKLLTSVAQVFDERGEGFILQGGNARLDRSDRSPHLAREDLCALLVEALKSYRREHKTAPARVVVHKTSHFDAAEVSGAREAAAYHNVDLLDLVSVRPSRARLLPATNRPVARGTGVAFDSASGLVYLKGTVPYFGTYPGPYVPRPIEFLIGDGDSTPAKIAQELLHLSKLNFNNTRFDTGDPVTVRAARRVGDILKHVEPGTLVASRFRYFT